MDHDLQRARKIKELYRPIIDISLERTTIEAPNFRVTIEYKPENLMVEKKRKLVI